MAEQAKASPLIKNLTPEQVGQALAEWCLVRAGREVDGMVKARMVWEFDLGRKLFRSVRVEVETL